jgi:cytochrome c oxidase subunit 7c
MGSPYHYPEGPRSNIPFNPLTKWFALRYWSFMGTCARKRDIRRVGNE